jgi:hypothetical protein
MEVTMPTKEQCVTESARICEYLLTDFETKLKTHKDKNHKWFIQGSIHGICRDLGLDKQVAVYLVLGSNSKQESWGNLREKTEVEPVKYIMRRAIVEKGRTLFPDYGFKVYFGDQVGNGDFHMKVDFYPHPKKTDDDSTEFVKVEKKAFKPKREFKPKTAKSSEDSSKPKTWANVTKQAAKPVAPKTPAVKTVESKTQTVNTGEVIEKLIADQKTITEQLAKITSLLASKVSA